MVESLSPRILFQDLCFFTPALQMIRELNASDPDVSGPQRRLAWSLLCAPMKGGGAAGHRLRAAQQLIRDVETAAEHNEDSLVQWRFLLEEWRWVARDQTVRLWLCSIGEKLPGSDTVAILDAIDAELLPILCLRWSLRPGRCSSVHINALLRTQFSRMRAATHRALAAHWLCRILRDPCPTALAAPLAAWLRGPSSDQASPIVWAYARRLSDEVKALTDDLWNLRAKQDVLQAVETVRAAFPSCLPLLDLKAELGCSLSSYHWNAQELDPALVLARHATLANPNNPTARALWMQLTKYESAPFMAHLERLFPLQQQALLRQQRSEAEQAVAAHAPIDCEKYTHAILGHVRAPCLPARRNPVARLLTQGMAWLYSPRDRWTKAAALLGLALCIGSQGRMALYEGHRRLQDRRYAQAARHERPGEEQTALEAAEAFLRNAEPAEQRVEEVRRFLLTAVLSEATRLHRAGRDRDAARFMSDHLEPIKP